MAKQNNNVVVTVEFDGAKWKVYGKKRSKNLLELETSESNSAAKKIVALTHHNNKGCIKYGDALQMVEDARRHFGRRTTLYSKKENSREVRA